jgi:hypothetical protein
MNNPLLIVLAIMVLAWLNSSADATPSQQRRQTESSGSRLALEVTYYRDRPPTYQQVIGRDTGSGYGLFRRVPSWTPPAGSLSVKGVSIRDHTLRADEKERLKKGIEAALKLVKRDLLSDLQKFVEPGSQSLDAQAFQTWLRVNKEKYEKWLSRL